MIRHSALPEYCSAPSFLAAIASNILHRLVSRCWYHPVSAGRSPQLAAALISVFDAVLSTARAACHHSARPARQLCIAGHVEVDQLVHHRRLIIDRQPAHRA